VKISYTNFKYYIEEHSPAEIRALKKVLTWYKREGSLKDLVVGDLVRIKPGTKPKTYSIGEVTYIEDKEVRVRFDDQSEHDYLIFGLERMTSETLLSYDQDGMHFYYGLLKILQEKTGIEFECLVSPKRDIVRTMPDKKILPGIELYDFQQSAVYKALTLRHGLCVIPTSGGKTEIMLSILRYAMDNNLIRKGLILTPTVGLSEQFANRGYKYNFTKKEIGILNADNKDYSSRVLSATMGSIGYAVENKKSELIDFMKEVDIILIDESQHLRADTWFDFIFSNISNVKYLLGFSGSPFLFTDPLHDYGDALIYGITGGPIYSIGYDHLQKVGLVAQAKVLYKNIGNIPIKSNQRFNTIYDKYIVNNKERNQCAENYIRTFVGSGLQTLVLVQRLEHAESLMKRISDLTQVSIFGGKVGVYYDKEGKRVEFKINFKKFREEVMSGKWQVVFGSSVMDEGMDFPSVGALILCAGGKSRIKNLQRLGRGLRKKSSGENCVYVLDFMDNTHVYLANHSKVRRKLFSDAHCALVSESDFLKMVKGHNKETKVEN
jgi:superfamily II DNA or RNA helicase